MLAVQPLAAVNTILAVPAATAFTSPAVPTVATAVLLLLHMPLPGGVMVSKVLPPTHK
jgi:hypothetical protein